MFQTELIFIYLIVKKEVGKHLKLLLHHVIKNSRPIGKKSNSFQLRAAALYPMLELATTLVVLHTLCVEMIRRAMPVPGSIS